MDECQIAFEKWASSYPFFELPLTKGNGAENGYWESETGLAWSAWQKVWSIRTTTPTNAELVEAITRSSKKLAAMAGLVGYYPESANEILFAKQIHDEIINVIEYATGGKINV